jgi:acetoin utilization protein AcuC
VPATAHYIGSEIYRTTNFGRNHPLAIPRVSLLTDLLRALDWLPDGRYVDSPQATPAQLARFHAPEYIAALMAADAAQSVPIAARERYHLGNMENPVFPGMFARPATACGGGLKAAELLRDAGRVFHPAGGTHHGRPDRASGFCYFNDPVLAIFAMLDRGLTRVAYVDVDAHHGDGVEAAFNGDARALCVSVHEAGRWPHTGTSAERAGGAARNLPVPKGMNDSEMDYVAEQAILPLVAGFRPEAVVIQCGADALADDPLSRQELSNRALWRVVERLLGAAPRLLVTGGGGYNPWSLARCWAGVWAVMNGVPIPDRLPQPAETLLRGVVWERAASRRRPDRWFTTLADEPNAGPVRDAVKRAVAAAVAP